MKIQSNKLILGLLVIFLSSCVPLSEQTFPSSGQLNKDALLEINQGSLLIDSETFIADSKEQVKNSAETGPILDSDAASYTITKATNRRQIDKEEKENILVADQLADSNEIFPITVNFDNISIHDMALMFSGATGVNILIGDEVKGEVSAKLENVPWDSALDSILKIKDLAKSLDPVGNIIRIHSRENIAAQEAFALASAATETTLRLSQRSLEPLYTEIFKLYYTDASVISKEIQSILNGSSGEDEEEASSGIEITIDERLNYIIVKATKEELDLIESLIAELDVRIKQILIEAFIVEASESFGEALGAKFGIAAPDANILGFRDETSSNEVDLTGEFLNEGTIAGLILGTSTKNLAIDLKASETKGITKILSNPRVFTLDGQKAEIKQVDEIPYTVIEDGVATLAFKDAGITLEVTPVLVGDGNIILTVAVTKSTADQTQAEPSINKSTITTKLLVQDQTIVVIGGVFTQDVQDARSQTPILGDLPLIGNLFKKVDKKEVRKEILIFLAPTII
ncbi:type IV pilus secretin PilQ [Candidatus Thioglobus sp.]|nr:type IV pilus secretin PilQ [Candidatus Thioglobus sp.]MDA9319524.1 type IV pilus secretin PilQ [Candidatus Thioglobus sp.]